jgi:hypothetical protein
MVAASDLGAGYAAYQGAGAAVESVVAILKDFVGLEGDTAALTLLEGIEMLRRMYLMVVKRGV